MATKIVPHVANMISDIENLLFKEGTSNDRELVIRLEKLGPEHFDVAASYDNLRLVDNQLGEPRQAKECHNGKMVIRLKKHGLEHVDVATSYDNLGLAHFQLGELSRAKEYHDRALDIRGSPIGFFNLAIMTKIFSQSRNPNALYRPVPMPIIPFFLGPFPKLRRAFPVGDDFLNQH